MRRRSTLNGFEDYIVSTRTYTIDGSKTYGSWSLSSSRAPYFSKSEYESNYCFRYNITPRAYIERSCSFTRFTYKEDTYASGKKVTEQISSKRMTTTDTGTASGTTFKSTSCCPSYCADSQKPTPTVSVGQTISSGSLTTGSTTICSYTVKVSSISAYTVTLKMELTNGSATVSFACNEDM